MLTLPARVHVAIRSNVLQRTIRLTLVCDRQISGGKGIWCAEEWVESCVDRKCLPSSAASWILIRKGGFK